MPYLLDTNVLSEPTRSHPHRGVLAWMRTLDPMESYLSVLTLGEIAKGLALMPPGPRKQALRDWLGHDLPQHFRGRILSIDVDVARNWGALGAEGRRMGRTLPAIDGLLLATAKTHRLTFVTRNLRDCGDRGVEVMNPWE